MKLPALLLLLAVGSAVAAPPPHAASYSVQQRHALGGGSGWDYLTIDRPRTISSSPAMTG
jgi:hypothetical protein